MLPVARVDSIQYTQECLLQHLGKQEQQNWPNTSVRNSNVYRRQASSVNELIGHVKTRVVRILAN